MFVIRLAEDLIRLIGLAAMGLLLALQLQGSEANVEAPRHWAFQPVEKPSPPQARLQRWVRTGVDNFVLATLEGRGLGPSPEADRATLARRLSFDLIGLPPTPELIEEFLSDRSSEAYDKLVERLLAAPQYGERWGRHWLDVAGYADSNGYFDADTDRPLAWKYRDYVVRSFNADKPFDQFVREQIAGDELAGYSRDGDVTPGMVELLTATHFLRNAPDGTGESDGNAMELRADRYAVLEGTVQIIGSAFLGMTLQCARCHDHKFEPVTQGEYYSLQSILKPVYNHDQWLRPNDRAIAVGTRAEREENKRAIEQHDREIKAMKEALDGLTAPFRKLAQQEALDQVSEPLRGELKKALDTKEKERTEAMKHLLKTNEAVVQIKDEELAKRFPGFAASRDSLGATLKKKEAARPKPLPQLAVATEVTPTPPPHLILTRGNYGSPGREAKPGVPAILDAAFRENGFSNRFAQIQASRGTESLAQKSSGRRAALADWITSSNQPMFARLAVNHVWQGHFGVGLVASADNFGLTGAKPTHPELLDWLACEFVRSGYSIKALHRIILNSATYRQSGALREEGFRIDPENRLLWRHPLRRLEAESLRDAMLAVSGQLELTIGGPAVPIDKTDEGQFVVNEDNPGARRRSLYVQQRRSRPATFLDVFDGVKFNPNCAIRVPSTIALQSLALLNSEFARARAKAFTERLAREAGDNAEVRLARAFLLAYGRAPEKSERADAGRFLDLQRAVYPGKPDAEARAWTDLCQMLMAANAFLYVD